MFITYSKTISESLPYSQESIRAVLSLTEDGATIPFIARYRKERTGNLDEVAIEAIIQAARKFKEFDERKEAILKSIESQGLLTDELRAKFNQCSSSADLEDLYLPYKPKRKTRASIAREHGLEPLARQIMSFYNGNIETLASKFLNKDVKDTEQAISGAKDIIAEWISENGNVRNSVRRIFRQEAVIKSSLKKNTEPEKAEKYKDYHEFEQNLSRIPAHRLHAIRRGEKEGFLSVSIRIEREKAISLMEGKLIKLKNEAGRLVAEAVKDCYVRLLEPSMESEFDTLSTEKADKEAIQTFKSNLFQLLMAAPLGKKKILAIDPGYKTGCKLVCLDEYGNPIHNETIYPHAPQNQTILASKKITSLIEAYQIQAIAIGNGTASRETENFIKRLKFSTPLQVFIVSEDGASVYSASSLAREEFPHYDVTVRGAISIGRRLMDPLAELVKIDPKSIGVGQYQHDVNQTFLKEGLDQTVINAVNRIGVDVNTASKQLLSYISGLGPQLADNIIQHRNDNQGIKSRNELLSVNRMGKKTFEQCAGFLRISQAENPLDNTSVHPESYSIVEKMAKKSNCTVAELISRKDLRTQLNLHDFISKDVGLPTLSDIMAELEKPGRDPRKQAKILEFDKNLYKIEDVIVGMVVPGIVNNITNFGAFVDIGIKESGLIHISQLRNEFISNPAEVVKLHQHVLVKVIDVDIPRKRIQLSLKDIDQPS